MKLSTYVVKNNTTNSLLKKDKLSHANDANY